uniref:Homoserine kinase n=1 Tax=Lotharella globosa TaxID=91324 RepID=A0A7S3YS76_9EUKA
MLSKASLRFSLQTRQRALTARGMLFSPAAHKRMARSLSSGFQGFEDGVERDSVTVAVPATSANMGPGFDTIGIALNVWNTMTVERSDKLQIHVSGEGSGKVPMDDSNLVVFGVKTAFEQAGMKMPPLRFKCHNRIPFARGLGSSSAGITAGLLAGLVLSGTRVPVWGHETFLQLACGIEGHPDNVAPAIYGGIQLGMHTGERWLSSRVPTPHGLQAIVFIPESIGETKVARAVLPETLTYKEAVYNISRASFLVNALNTGNLADLKYATQDALHQPQRSAQFPHMTPVIEVVTHLQFFRPCSPC